MLNQNNRKRPKPYIDRALQIFKERNGKVIVEVGCMRQMLTHDVNDYSLPCCNDGHSSVILAKAAEKFYSVDIAEEHCIITKECLNNLGLNNAEVLCDDGIEFLKRFDKNIDLLYLDAWDVGTYNYAEYHLEAYLVSKKNLNENSLILIDDSDVFEKNGELFISNNGFEGKAKLVIPEALKDGFKVIFSERQTLLSK